MLVIQPTADGRFHISNNHRSGYAHDMASARTLAYDWGHTDLSINKALAEMRAGGTAQAPERGWRVSRRERAQPRPAPGEPVKAEPPAPEAGQAGAVKPGAPKGERPKKEPRRRRAPAEVKPAAKAVGDRPVKRATAPAKAAPEPAVAPKRGARKAAAPKPAPAARKPVEPKAGDPRERALALFRAGAKELAALERDTLPFARAPWSELRQMAEHIAACLEGKRVVTRQSTDD